MDYIKWSQEFNTNIEEIDQQHKQLIKIINKLYSGIKNQQEKVNLDDILFELIKYTLIHFSTEEELMSINNYDDFNSHNLQHSEFEEKVTQFFNDFKNGKSEISIELLEFLKLWLINHILISDKKLGNFLLLKNTIELM